MFKLSMTVAVCVSLLNSCVSDRHLLFFTNTSFGLEVGGDPASGAPKIAIGYKRQEGTVFPVYDVSEEFTGTTGLWGTPVKVKGGLVDTAYSVIAKYAGGAQAGDAEMSNAQWFATGEAAKSLAVQPGIAGAVTGNARIAEAATNQTAILIDGSIPSNIKRSALWTAFEFVANADTPEADALESRLTGFALRYKTPKVELYSITQRSPIVVSKTEANAPLSKDDYTLINLYSGALEDSIDAIQALLVDPMAKEEDQQSSPDSTRREELLRERDQQKELLVEFDENLRKSEEVRDVLAFFARVFSDPKGQR